MGIISRANRGKVFMLALTLEALYRSQARNPMVFIQQEESNPPTYPMKM
jgi:hypothetical protein